MTGSRARSRFPWLLAGLTAASLLFVAPRARAQDAITIFEEGKRLADQGKWAEACPKFEAAHQMKPDALGITLNLAVCNKNIGKTASAWALFKDASFRAKKSGEADRATFAEKEAAALEPTLSRLRVDAEDTPGLMVRVDDKEVAKGALGTPFPVDPGEHKVEATAPGYLVWSTAVHVGAGKAQETIKIPNLQKGPPPPGSGPNPALRISAYAVGGVGLAGLAVGGLFGGLALAAKSTLTSACPGNACTGDTRDTRAAAATKATVSTIGFAAGGAALATGIVLFIVSGRSSAPAQDQKGPAPKVGFVPEVGPGGGSLSLVGSF